MGLLRQVRVLVAFATGGVSRRDQVHLGAGRAADLLRMGDGEQQAIARHSKGKPALFRARRGHPLASSRHASSVPRAAIAAMGHMAARMPAPGAEPADQQVGEQPIGVMQRELRGEEGRAVGGCGRASQGRPA